MNRNLTALVLFLSLTIFSAVHTYAQEDSTMARPETSDSSDSDLPKSKSCTKPMAHYGIELGLNISSYSAFNGSGSTYSYSPQFGPRAGLVMELPLCGCGQFFFQPGLFYVMNGVKGSATVISENNQENTTVNTIELPLNFTYHFNDCGKNSFYVGIGPYVGYNLGGRVKNSATGLDSYDLSIGSGSSNDLKAFDAGGDVVAGYELVNGLYMSVRYQAGLMNLSPVSGNTNRLMSYGLQVGYLFGKKPCKKAVPQAPMPNAWDE